MIYRVSFSLVTYKHSVYTISPLLSSISELCAAYANEIEVELLIHDNSPTSRVEYTYLQRFYNSFRSQYFSDGKNIGFGSGHNSNARKASPDTDLIIIVNPDISFNAQDLIKLIRLFRRDTTLSCVAPLVINQTGDIQYSSKKNPTLLSLFLGRFPFIRKVRYFEDYYFAHRNQSYDYTSQSFEAEYLSGCFLAIPYVLFSHSGGFDPTYFLHLEDADITRRLAKYGRTVHFPHSIVTHRWARGSHTSFFQTVCLLKSIIAYHKIWGISLF